MPLITLRIVVDDREEQMAEYICDWPDCPNFAVQVVAVRELRARAVLCVQHAARVSPQSGA